MPHTKAIKHRALVMALRVVAHVASSQSAHPQVGQMECRAMLMGQFRVIPSTQAIKHRALVMALRVVAHVASSQSAHPQLGQMECRAMLMGQFRVKNSLTLRIRALKVFAATRIYNRFKILIYR